MSSDEASSTGQDMLGAFIRTQRQLADLSLRQLSAQSHVSNAYLSQIERGLHQPSVAVLRSIAEALNLSAETLLTQAGLLDTRDPSSPTMSSVEEAINADPALTAENKRVLLGVYRSLRSTSPEHPAHTSAADASGTTNEKGTSA